MTTKVKLTVLVSVKNEELNLLRSLKPLGRFEQVVVLDSNSTDNTKLIVEDYGYEYVNFNWDGKYPKKRNWFLQSGLAKFDWVLFLDADEIIDDRLIDEIGILITSNFYQAYFGNFNNYFLGRKLKYGVKFKKIVLLNKNYGKYERIEENSWSALDMEVHEHLIVNGRTGQLKNLIDHNDFKDLESFIDKHNKYSSWESRRITDIKTNIKHLGIRQKIKYLIISHWWFSFAYFFITYIVKFGFLDGKKGFYFAVLKWTYFFQVYLKLKFPKIENR
jgi:glycosyltransferase involved in cell wall biosynthesis